MGITKGMEKSLVARRWCFGLAVAVCMAGFLRVWEAPFNRFSLGAALFLTLVPGLLATALYSWSASVGRGGFGVLLRLAEYGLFVYLLGLVFRFGAYFVFSGSCTSVDGYTEIGRELGVMIWPVAVMLSSFFFRLLPAVPAPQAEE